MHYVPSDDGVYVYFRYDSSQTIMIAMNTGKETKTISPANYSERTNGFSKIKNVITGEAGALKDFSLAPKTSVVWELTN
ncbi:MAG: cyclomaltodextrinase C-terminal domain-containing protein [Bacteroidota bacterium]|nr:cyclomaltodextrinase C-terminal domain-containing protein [Bacteroidota bacterium]